MNYICLLILMAQDTAQSYASLLESKSHLVQLHLLPGQAHKIVMSTFIWSVLDMGKNN